MENNGSALGLKSNRCIHSKKWDVRLLDKLITQHMKPNITQVFDMAEFFDKESLIDTLYTLHTELQGVQKRL